MSSRKWLRLALVIALGTAAGPAQASEAELLKRLEAMEQELATLKRKLEVKEEIDATRLRDAPIATAGPDGLSLRSADRKSYLIRFRGVAQFDGRFFSEADTDDTTDNLDTFALRRIRPTLEGTLGRYVDFRFTPDFAGGTATLFDAYGNLRYGSEAQLQFGKYKPPVGLERLQSASALSFVERGLPTFLVPTRDVGVMLHGDFEEGLFSYQLAAFNGVRDSGNVENLDQDTDDTKDLVGRVFAHPFRNLSIGPLQGLGLGVSTSYGDENQAPPSFRTAGATTRFLAFRADVRADGERFRLSPQGYWYWGPLGVLTEYVSSHSNYRRLARETGARSEAWQIAASYVLTGENASYRGVVPRSDFRPDGSGWGAFELAARLGHIEFEDELFPFFVDPAVSAEEADQWTFGVNWHLNRWAKLVLNYERTSFERGALADQDRRTEGVWLGRFQVAY
jgi:phosphate-selective porin OprO/OprP